MLQHIKEIITKKNVSIHDIMADIPTIQRELKLEAVNTIIEHQNKIYQEINYYFTEHHIFIVSFERNDKDYLIDGQHRVTAFNSLRKEYPERTINLNVCYIKIKKNCPESEEEKIINYWYDFVNKCTPNPVSTLGIDRYKILQGIRDYFTKNFKDYIKTTSKPQKPHVNLDKLSEYIIENKIIESLDISKSEEFINKIIELNTYYSTLKPEQFKKFGLTDIHTLIEKKNKHNNDLYLGFYNKFEWLERMLESKKHNKPYEDLFHISYNYRPRINTNLREKVWKNVNGSILDGICYCCTEPLSYKSFECGHIIPVSLGGTTDEKNLRPICHDCNIDMGTQNLEEYKISRVL